MKVDYYETLGVSRDVDDKALKSAFRKLAMQYHPDRNPGDKDAEARFKELGEAYEVLKAMPPSRMAARAAPASGAISPPPWPISSTTSSAR